MAIENDDRFLIDDAGVSKKIRASVLKPELNGTYKDMKLLVNKADFSSRWVYCKDLQSNLPNDHWLLVERSDVSYRVSGSDVHNYFPSGPAGATGVITDSHTTPITQGQRGTHDLTVTSQATPNFVDNEAIRMVDINGDTASYVPVTSTITNVDATNPAAIQLTFADPSPDLKFFQPQDVVQTGVHVISRDPAALTMVVNGGDWSDGSSAPGTDQSQLWSSQVSLKPSDVQYLSGKGPEQAFNNDMAAYNYTTVAGYFGTSTIRVEFDPPMSGQLVLIGDAALDPVKQTVVVTADAGDGTFTDAMTCNVVENSISNVSNCTAIEISQSVAQADWQSTGTVFTSQVMLKGVKFDGLLLVDQGETEVTGSSKSGAGKANGIPAGTTFSVKDSNGQWIDNTNRLGESFYVKNGSSRISLQRYADEFGVMAAVQEARNLGYSTDSIRDMRLMTDEQFERAVDELDRQS